MNYPSKIDHWKTSEKNNSATAFNTLYIKEQRNMSSLYFKN